jgi:hypothetical protein
MRVISALQKLRYLQLALPLKIAKAILLGEIEISFGNFERSNRQAQVAKAKSFVIRLARRAATRPHRLAV